MTLVVNEGLLETNDVSMTYQWVHDSILEAAFSLASPPDLCALQFQVGDILVHQLDQRIQRETIFVAVNLLNAGTPQFIENSKRVELAELNLRAAKTSVKVSAYESASKYATRGIELLPDNSWVHHFYLVLELHSIGAEVEGCLGHVERMEHHCNIVIQKERPLLDKLRVYHVLLDSTADRGKVPEATKLCLDVLKDLGCTFPKNDLSINVLTIVGVLGFQARVGSRTPEDISKLAVMTDQRKIELMKLIDKLATYRYLSGNALFAVTILRRLNYTVRYGICDSASINFAGLGIILTGKLFNFQAGSQYARFSLLLLEKLNVKMFHARTMMLAYGWVLPWTQPTQSVLKHLLIAYETGMQTGDTETALYSIMSYIYTSFQSGRSLHTIEADCRVYLRQMHELKREKARSHTMTIYQTVLNLMRKSEDPCVLTGHAMDQEIMIKKSSVENDNVTLSMIQALRTQLFALFGRHEKGAEYAISVGDRLAEQIPCSTMVAVDPFFRGLSFFAMARTTKKVKYRRHAMKARRTIRSFVKKGNPNVRHSLSFLDAGMAALKGKQRAAKKHYELAVIMASRGGFLHDAALANEHLAEFLLESVKDEEMAAFRFHQAIRLYYEWGANLKASMLEKRHEGLLLEHPDLKFGGISRPLTGGSDMRL